MSDNKDKSNRGRSGQGNLKNIIESLKEKDYIVSYEEDYRDGYDGCEENQFFYQYLITFEDGACWILHSTASIRSDRMNIPQWNAEHLKKINTRIKKAYVVYPNGLSDQELKNARNYQGKIERGRHYSAVDGVVSQSELYSLVENYALGLIGNHGQALAKRGNNFESHIVEILNNTENFFKWKNKDKIKTGFMYDMFIELVQDMGLDRGQVTGIRATNNIPRLPSGGKAKTDILVFADTCYGEQIYTYSCKKSGSGWVSAHEYAADKFVDVLHIKEQELVDALYDFQSAGSLKNMTPSLYEVMCRELPAYNDRLNKWVLGGIGGQGDSETQWAQKIITYNQNTEDFSIASIEEYIELLEEEGVTGNFGTLFKWTYPSGGRGKRIQLKMKVD